MPRPKSDTVQISVRVPTEWLEKADRVAAHLSKPGLVASRTDAFRYALARGLEALVEEADAQAPAQKVARSKR